ncbi:helix-turn-helix domain-containing protein [Sneathiella litorea]|uniref:Helix-turn-helix domain-containing protein n=1 Tax=Sneathiella litorea TaxID=2606216 RepID=A0A6L8WCA2_9PROT|nr:XRE family transcriptional regulator [Sneathiella litorea]MZR31767.1 helix-turn-helix domain-containing protein [Sneathiella litorea]
MSEPLNNPPAVGATVNRLRKEKHLTLDQLAAVCGVSKSMLSQIERNETNPTLATVWRLAEALGVTIDDIVRGDDPTHSLTVVNGASIPVLNDAKGHYSLKVLGPASLVNDMEWYEVAIKPGGKMTSNPHTARTTEHLTVFSGELTVKAGIETERVYAGETARYAADQPHEIANTGAEEARALLVVLMGKQI